MKKLIYLILLFVCIGCSNNEILNEKNDDSYIEVIPSSSMPFIEQLGEDTVLMNNSDIIKYNQEIKNKTKALYDLEDIKSLNKEEILYYINNYKLPSLPKYNDHRKITPSEINLITNNRNIDKIEDKDTLQKGIIVNRTNLKSYPTDIHFFDSDTIDNFDRIQESELHVNTPVLIIHESTDQKWYFVISQIYVGWVKQDDVAIASDNDWNFFINNKSFAIITSPMVEVENYLLDMSVKLPYEEEVNSNYKLIVPIKDKNGLVAKKSIIVSRDKAHIGYLPYTKKNVYIQAFKYEGRDYKWSGMDNGVDCSSYVANIYRTFGFIFPRNTSSQNISVGKEISLENMNIIEKEKIISNYYPSLLYQKGHVMIYLGKINDNNYIIHASGNKLKVVLENLNSSNKYLSSINKLVLVSP